MYLLMTLTSPTGKVLRFSPHCEAGEALVRSLMEVGDRMTTEVYATREERDAEYAMRANGVRS